MIWKGQNKLKPKGMVQYTDKITISINFNTENFYALKMNQQKLTVELGYMCPRGLLGSTSSDTHQVVEI